MGVHFFVKGFKPVNDTWRKMYAAYEACESAGVAPPKEVLDFFEGVKFTYIEAAGIETDINEAITPWDDGDAREGFEVDIDKLPEGVTVVRFGCSY